MNEEEDKIVERIRELIRNNAPYADRQFARLNNSKEYAKAEKLEKRKNIYGNLFPNG